MLKGLDDYINCHEVYEDFANAIILSCLDDYRAWFKEHYRKHPNLSWRDVVNYSIKPHSKRECRIDNHATTAVRFLLSPDMELYSKIPGTTLLEFVEKQVKENPKKKVYRPRVNVIDKRKRED